MINAIIVDDELNAITNLKWEIGNLCDDVFIADAFTDPGEAISAINYLKPDCVFLDIEMPEMDGFELLSRLTFRNFDLVITTAYDNYAVKAFKEHAIDYLLKPIDGDDLEAAIERIRENQTRNVLGKELRKIVETFLPAKHSGRLALPVAGKTVFIAVGDITHCRSKGNYTEIFLSNDKMQLFSKKLKELETALSGYSFVRVHHSYLVNINYIKEFVKTDGQYLVLQGGEYIPISRSRKHELKQILNF